MIRNRSGYSFRSATGHLKDVVARIEECAYPAAAITDRASTFGYARWAKLCKEKGLKAVFGLELAVTHKHSLRERKNWTDYWTFIAINDIVRINRLLALATEQFYYRPQITYEQAIAAKGVVKIVGNRSDFSAFKPSPDIYVGLSPSCSKGYITDALKKGHNLAACSDNSWTRNTEEDQILYETILGRDASLQSYDQFIQSESEWYKSTQYATNLLQQQNAVKNSHLILQWCNATLRQSTLLDPEKSKTLRAMCEDGAQLLECDLSDPIYASRLDRELKLIADKGYENYFYILSDLCQWSRKNLLMGPARGSSAGSLVCYLLEITTVNPIKYGTIFERFLDLNRGGYKFNKEFDKTGLF